MPPGAPYDSILRPYNIRVDAFTTTTATISNPPVLHLLSHTHSDHIVGLSSKSFASTIICSHDARDMLLNHEVYKERELYETEVRGERVKTFGHLQRGPTLAVDGTLISDGYRDLLRPLPLNTPTQFEYYDREVVTITLIDANHCPGSVMFLVEGQHGAVLHTGDFRGEPWYLESLLHNPYLQPYLSCKTSRRSGDRGHSPQNKVVNSLECIYLDTACMLSTTIVPTKDDATNGLLELMDCYPKGTRFFVNAWTWGYEEVLTAIARHFNVKIHVDRYKFTIFSKLRDPFLRTICTVEEGVTHFHACERFDRCNEVTDGAGAVYVNPVTLGKEKWTQYREETTAKLRDGVLPPSLLVPLSRHSPLPELQAFVGLFRPKQLVPNSLIPELKGLDWLAMASMFKDVVASTSITSPQFDSRAFWIDMGSLEGCRDAALENLVGDGVDDLASRWAEDDKLLTKLKLIREHLTGSERAFVNAAIGGQATEPVQPHAAVTLLPRTPTRSFKPRYMRAESDEDTDDDEAADERARTAHLLFGDLADTSGKASPWHRLSSSPQTPSPVHSAALRRTVSELPSPSRAVQPFLSPPESPRSPGSFAYREGLRSQRKAGERATSRPEGHLQSPSRRPLKSPFTQVSPRPSAVASTKHSPFKDVNDGRASDPSSPVAAISAQGQGHGRYRVQFANHSPTGETSTSRHYTTSVRLVPPSPGRSPLRKKRRREEQMKIADKLSSARPDLVTESYAAKRARRMARLAKQTNSTGYEADAVTGHDWSTGQSNGISAKGKTSIDWERSRIMAETIRQAVSRGERPSFQLPALACVETQSQP